MVEPWRLTVKVSVHCAMRNSISVLSWSGEWEIWLAFWKRQVRNPDPPLLGMHLGSCLTLTERSQMLAMLDNSSSLETRIPL